MSRFFSEKFTDLEAYVPGEQPKEQQYIKLNTNENAFPPHPAVAEAAEQAARKLHLYPDTECTELRKTLAERLGLSPEPLQRPRYRSTVPTHGVITCWYPSRRSFSLI